MSRDGTSIIDSGGQRSAATRIAKILLVVAGTLGALYLVVGLLSQLFYVWSVKLALRTVETLVAPSLAPFLLRVSAVVGAVVLAALLVAVLGFFKARRLESLESLKHQ